jgi:hypothetical protein
MSRISRISIISKIMNRRISKRINSRMNDAFRALVDNLLERAHSWAPLLRVG